MSTRPSAIDRAADMAFIRENLSPEARLEASGLTNPEFWRLATKRVLGGHVSQEEIRELNGPSRGMKALLDSMDEKTPNVALLPENEVVRYLALLGPIESMQMSAFANCHSERARTPQEVIAQKNFYTISRIIRQMQSSDPGWGSLDRVDGKGPHALRTRRGLDTTPATVSTADGKAVEPQK